MPKFTVYVNFYRYDGEGRKVTFPRKEKLRLEVVGLRVFRGRMNRTEARLEFEDGTHVDIPKYSKWNPSTKVAQIAANYEKWLYVHRFDSADEGGNGNG